MVFECCSSGSIAWTDLVDRLSGGVWPMIVVLVRRCGTAAWSSGWHKVVCWLKEWLSWTHDDRVWLSLTKDVDWVLFASLMGNCSGVIVLLMMYP